MSHILRTEADIDRLAVFLKRRKLPLTVSVESGEKRSVDQNRLQRLWCGEVSEQLGDRSPEEVRAETKLRCGVPILRAQNDEFRAAYDKSVRGLPYEVKLSLMMEPLDFPVTRLMTKPQKSEYLDAMFRHWSAEGVILTRPER